MNKTTRKAYIYRIRCEATQKEYYGVTRKPWKRVLDHFYKNCGSRLIHRAVAKYGPDEFSFDVILVGTEEYCYAMEPKVIAAFQSQVPNGYNLSEGGETVWLAKGDKHSEETKAKMSEVRKGKFKGGGWQAGKPRDPETVAKVAAANRGRKHTPEAVENMRAAAKSRKPRTVKPTEESRAKHSETMKRIWAERRAKANPDK